MWMFLLILTFNLIALLFTAIAASSQPTRVNKLTVVIALCGFLLALYQFDKRRFNPFVLAATSLLNLFLIMWLVKQRSGRTPKR
jgi:hypothetical protein